MSEQPLWQPSRQQIDRANITHFAQNVHAKWGIAVDSYADLWRWSIDCPEQFWATLWDYCGVISAHRGNTILMDGDKMPGAQWFPEARLNFTENLLCNPARYKNDSDALIFWGENKVKRRFNHLELYHAVAQVSAALRAQGVQAGDRVAAYMPNMPETIVVMLAAASIGAVFSSASPDFGIQGVLDRFGQIQPKILFSVDGYYYNGKKIDVLEKLIEIADQLPSVQQVVIVPYTEAHPALEKIRGAIAYPDWITPHAQVAEIAFSYLPFNHPLYIMYSSGTTGVPKCIVHGAGGTLLQHLKEHRLHADLHSGDRLFYFTTCGWMMWNWLASGLASGATLLLYDGSPFLEQGKIIFDYLEQEHATHFGTSGKFIDAIAKANLCPVQSHQLDSLRVILSTGSPLVPEGFDYVYKNIKADVCLASISGGTDIVSCFVLGNPTLPVWRGEIQCRGLGMAVDVFDDQGHSIREQKGELVCTKPFPAMPIKFWNDLDGEKYYQAYFAYFPHVWHHGDYVEITAHNGMIIYGRSDATLNPGGVRIGTAEIYRQVEKLDEVVESIVIGQDWDNDVRIILFVRLREEVVLDEILIKKIKETIRANTTPRHVPAKILQVLDIPRTKSGKIVELAVRNMVHGQPIKNKEALANPAALEYFNNRIELQN